MMEFIVLGKIPGTGIYVSFETVLVMALVALLVKLTINLTSQIKAHQKQAEIEAKAI